MKIAKIISFLGVLAMTVALFNGFFNGNFQSDGAELMANPWGVVSLVDLYVGFIIFSLWIVLREKSLLSKIAWVMAMMILGFFAGSLYVLITLYRSDDDWLTFFLGSKKESFMASNRE